LLPFASRHAHPPLASAKTKVVPVIPAVDLQYAIERLKDRLHVAVIYGGDKNEDGAVVHPTANTRSWKSYRPVAEDIGAALERLGFKHVELFAEDMRLPERLIARGTHLAWLNSGGVQGFNPMAHAPSILEMIGIPYVGHDPLLAGTLDNKHTFKRELAHLGIPTPPFMTWHMARGPFRPEANSRFRTIFHDYDGPFVVKPVSGRASLHVHIVENVAGLPDKVAEIFEISNNHVLIEAYVGGREFCVAACGPIVARNGEIMRRFEPFVFAPIERVLDKGERIFTSMDQRKITGDRAIGLDPAKDYEEIQQLVELGRQIFLDFNIDALVRIDVRSDAKGDMFVLEANPKPDLKFPTGDSTNLICVGLAREGMSYDDLILSLLANRLDALIGHRRLFAAHIVALLDI
jgi:D-alanine-D-alanine ligase